jgi:hypothetical protein
MPKVDNTSAALPETPMLAPLQALRQPLPLISAIVIAAVGAFVWFAAAQSPAKQGEALVPATLADLSESLVTPVDNNNHGAVGAAVATLRLPPAQRAEIERDIVSKQRRIGWMVLTDSMDPDGDIVAVESDGVVQHVSLNKTWVPIAVLVSDTPIGITAVRDGGGGGITVAFASRNGSQAARIMSLGEHITVVP